MDHGKLQSKLVKQNTFLAAGTHDAFLSSLTTSLSLVASGKGSLFLFFPATTRAFLVGILKNNI